jgi:hypothetical protein
MQGGKNMAKRKHLQIQKQGVEAWNKWREQHYEIVPDLTGADLRDAHLIDAHLFRANLSDANLMGANLSRVDFSSANLSGADLSYAVLVGANFERAKLNNCPVYGVSAWDLRLQGAEQANLCITPADQPRVTCDNLKVAQFVYLLLNNPEVREVIDTVTSKVVLILGRFTPERQAVLDAMADELRKRDLVPIIFDFERATSRDFTETIKTLAGMSRFVIADITNPKSAPLELQATVPDYQIPFVPIIQESEERFSMFSDLTKYPWVLTLLKYPSPEGLIAVFEKAIINRAFDKYKELLRLKGQGMETVSVKDFLGGSS